MIKKHLVLAIITFTFSQLNAQLFPQKIDVEWSKIKVNINGKVEIYKDAKVWPNNSKSWDWSITDTHHVPGVQIADFNEFVDSVDIIILTEGYDGVLQIKPETLAYLLKNWASNGRQFYIERTPNAVELYNKLTAEGKKVGILVHSTC